MAQTHTIEEARERFNTLPPEIKKLLYSQEMALILQKVGEKNQLHIDQVDALYTETGQLMLGFSETKEYVEDLVDILKIEQQKAEAIAHDVDEMLFSKIRAQMKAFYEAHNKPAAVVTPPEAPVSKLPPIPERSATPNSIVNPMPEVKPVPPVPAPQTPPAAPPPPTVATAPAPTAPAVPVKQPDLHPADVMLSQKTVDLPIPQAPQQKAPPPAPGSYKKDPYREPIEP